MRLKGYDYSTPGEYFVTICTKWRICWFGEIEEGKMSLSEIGSIVAGEWMRTPLIRPNVRLDEWCVMPNHFHGIVVIDEKKGGVEASEGLLEQSLVETHSSASRQRNTTQRINTFGPQRHNLSSIIRGFKAAATTRIHSAGYNDFKWQSLFHDHIIRDEDELNRIRDYIINNPLNWQSDRN